MVPCSTKLPAGSQPVTFPLGLFSFEFIIRKGKKLNDLFDANDLGLGPVVVPSATAVADTPPSIPNSAALPKRGRPAKSTTSGSNSSSGILFFDLETIPDYSRADQFDLEPIPAEIPRATVAEMGDNLPSVLLAKTVEKITEIVEAKRPCEEYLAGLEKMEGSREKGPRDGVSKLIKKIRGLDAGRADLLAARRKEMAVSPEMNRIVAFGWRKFGDTATQSLVIGGEGDAAVTETEILERFWDMVHGRVIVCGFNILGFDLPTIFVRSMILGVAPSRLFDLKPWGTDCIDLMKLRFPAGQSKGLKFIGAALGLTNTAEGVDGSQVELLWDTGEFGKIGEYVRSDVDLCVELHVKYRGFWC